VHTMHTPKDSHAPADTLFVWLEHLRLGEPMQSGPLTLVPVYGGEVPNPLAYRTLSEALACGEVTIAEHTSPTVPNLQLTNHGPLPVLILDGEEVAGGLQNRVVNTTLLIPAKSGFDLPVSCIEHGRWHEASTDFKAGEAVHPTLRRQKVEQVSASLAVVAAPIADQSAVWAEVATRHRRTGTRSATAALRDAYAANNAELTVAERDLGVPAGDPTGVVALVEGHAVCADLFDRSATLRDYWPRLVRSYALEAIGSRTREPRVDSAQRLLGRPIGASCRPFASPGLGVDLRITGNGVVGSSLVHAGNVLHTALFRQHHPRTPTSISTPRQRRRHIAR
jgi:hypothetical protein